MTLPGSTWFSNGPTIHSSDWDVVFGQYNAYIAQLLSDSDWIAPTLTNSWVNFASGYMTAGYRKVRDIVTLRGTVKLGSGSIFTLPVGYRPQITSGGPLLFTQPASTGVTGIANVEVTAAGVVQVAGYLAGGGNAFLALDGINFYGA